ncbi:MAG: hypothetical protein Q4C46_06565 [Bacillota bacterium]|nr:hypothetical protein [Bacillota bacterium]
MSFLFEKMSREECEAVREADGYDRGFECGKREGEAAGIEKGEAIGKRVIAANMKSEGESIEKIVAYTGLSAEEIDEL